MASNEDCEKERLRRRRDLERDQISQAISGKRGLNKEIGGSCLQFNCLDCLGAESMICSKKRRAASRSRKTSAS